MAITLTENGLSYSPEGQRVIRRANGKDYWLLRWDERRVHMHDYHLRSDGKPVVRTVGKKMFESCYDYPTGDPA